MLSTTSPGPSSRNTARRLSSTSTPSSLGRYQLERVVGRGSNGVVFAGYDPQLQRKVAVKVFVHATPLADVVREGAALAIASHPNVVAVHDIGHDEGLGFLVMDIAEGGTLAGYMRTGHAWREIVELFVQAGRGIAVAHQAGIAHGDIKPSNVLIGLDGRPQVADFGLASGSGHVGPKPRGGTLVYMAPERLEGGPPDPTSDQFSFCVTLWEAIHRVRPWDSNAAAVVGTTAPRRARLSGRVPASLDRVLLRGLAARPAGRFKSMSALVDALVGVVTKADRRRARRRTVAVALASVALASVLDRFT